MTVDEGGPREPAQPTALRNVRRVAVAVGCAVLAGCATSSPGGTDQPVIWDTAARRAITEAEFVQRLTAARYRLLGEAHDNPEHHRLRAALIRRIAGNGARPAVVFEQFDVERNEALAAAQRRANNDAQRDAETIAAAGGLDGRNWGWPLHKPLVEAALATGLPIRAGNPSRAELMTAARADPATTPESVWGRRYATAEWSAEQQSRMRDTIVDGHCGKLPDAAVPALVRAQRMRDAALAEALVGAAAERRDDGAILIAGNGHVRRDLGVPVYLIDPESGMTRRDVVSVGFVERAEGTGPAGAMPSRDETDAYDIVWFTTARRRDDPCARMSAPAVTPAVTPGESPRSSPGSTRMPG